MTQDIFNQKQKLFDRWAPYYDIPFTAAFYLAVQKRLLEFVTLPDSPQVLDLGCGTGRLLNRLAAKFPTLFGIGLDLSPEMLFHARRNNQHRPRLIFKQGNVESLPFANQQFDAVFNTISFLHYPHPQQVLSEVRRVLKPNGYYYLADITVSDSRKKQTTPFSAGGMRFYSGSKREELGKQAGLKCLSHHHLLFPVLLTIFTPH
ncbi:MAG: class I SAM-dependent methyltransferase [Halothece sp.]